MPQVTTTASIHTADNSKNMDRASIDKMIRHACFLPVSCKTPSMPASATSSSTSVSKPFAQPVFPALYKQHLAVYQRMGQLFSRFGVNPLHSSTCNIHLFCTLLLRKALQVDEPYSFVLVNCHGYAA